MEEEEGLEQQLEKIYLSDDGEEEEEEVDAVSIHSDLNAELLVGVRGDIVQHWVEDNRSHFQQAVELQDVKMAPFKKEFKVTFTASCARS